MDSPYFSVVVPTHNRANILKRAVDSVLCQTFDNFELIIVDDHSEDNTADYINSISDDRVKYVLNNRTPGACGARNEGVFLAKGKWIAFLDDDDVWLSRKLEFQYNFIANLGPKVGLVSTDYVIIKDYGKKEQTIQNRLSGWVQEKLLHGGYFGCLSSNCIKFDVLNQINGFDESFLSNQDLDLWIRIAEVAKFDFVPLPLVVMFQENRKDRIGKNPVKKLQGNLRIYKKFKGLIDINPFLKHRYNSKILTYALILKQKEIFFKCFPWFLSGVVVDSSQFVHTLRTLLLSLYINRKIFICFRF